MIRSFLMNLAVLLGGILLYLPNQAFSSCVDEGVEEALNASKPSRAIETPLAWTILTETEPGIRLAMYTLGRSVDRNQDTITNVIASMQNFFVAKMPETGADYFNHHFLPEIEWKLMRISERIQKHPLSTRFHEDVFRGIVAQEINFEQVHGTDPQQPPLRSSAGKSISTFRITSDFILDPVQNQISELLKEIHLGYLNLEVSHDIWVRYRDPRSLSSIQDQDLVAFMLRSIGEWHTQSLIKFPKIQQAKMKTEVYEVLRDDINSVRTFLKEIEIFSRRSTQYPDMPLFESDLKQRFIEHTNLHHELLRAPR